MDEKYKTYWIVELIVLITALIFTFIMIVFKERFVSSTAPFLSVVSFIFGLTLGPMIPGIFYKGGNGFNLVFGKFTKKEKAFAWFFLELLIGVTILSALIWSSNYLFKTFFNYIHLILIEWILIVYIWFSQRSKYKFPVFYTIITNLILFGNAFFIYKLY